MKKTVSSVLTVLEYIRGIERYYFLLNLISSILYNMIPVSNLWMLKIIVDIVTYGTIKDLGKVITVLILFGLIQTLMQVQHSYIVNIYNVKKEVILRRELNKKLFSKIENIDLIDIETSTYYDKYEKVAQEIDNRYIEICNTVVDGLSNLVGSLGIIVSLAFLKPIFIVFALLNVCLNMYCASKKNKLVFDKNMALVPIKRVKDYVKRIFFLKDYSEEIKINETKYIVDKYEKSCTDELNTLNKYLNKILVKDNEMIIGRLVISIAEIYLLVVYILDDVLLVGSFMAIINGISTLTMYLSGVIQFLTSINKHSMYYDNINEFMSYQSKVELSGRDMELGNFSQLRFENVSFSYPNSGFRIDDINLCIEAGQKVAIVGLNGAGKSTLLKMMLKLYFQDSGDIYLNGVNYNELSTKTIREYFSTVMQNSQLFSFSIRENLVQGGINEGNDENRLTIALKLADLSKKINSLPLKEETIISTEFDNLGINFSGGEQQKLALARAYYKDCDIIILDEPSQALDPESERLFIDTLMSLNKTIIMVTHRLAHASQMDKIYFMKEGKIIEQGNHADLMSLKGNYYNFYQKQLETYTTLTN